jgi:uncharacterized protein (DUF1697 family)
MGKLIALLRGVNVGARTRVPMAELKPLCATLGWRNVETYIQSGNVVFEADEAPAALEAQLETALEARFGLSTAVMVRSAAAWRAYAGQCPFREAAEKEANLVLLGVCKRPPRPESAGEIEARGANGERVAIAGDALWFHYAGGVGPSKLSPSLIDRLAGAPVTARNWRTVLKLKEMAAA